MYGLYVLGGKFLFYKYITSKEVSAQTSSARPEKLKGAINQGPEKSRLRTVQPPVCTVRTRVLVMVGRFLIHFEY